MTLSTVGSLKPLTCDLGGGTLALNGATGSWTLDSGTMRNGSIVQEAGNSLRITGHPSNTPDAVAVTGDLSTNALNAFLRIRNGLVLHGTVSVSNGAALDFAGNRCLR